jgi:hypothetical protein
VQRVLGSQATVAFGLVTQPSDPAFGDPTGTPAPTNAARFADDVTVRCTGNVQSVRVPLVPVPCGDEGCVPRPGLEKGVRADVFWLMDFRSDGDEQDVVSLDVRV